MPNIEIGTMPENGDVGWGPLIIAALMTLKNGVNQCSDLVHTHSNYATQSEISNLRTELDNCLSQLQYLFLNLSNIAITAQVSNSFSGISVRCETAPPGLGVMLWKVRLTAINSDTMDEEILTSPIKNMYIPHALLTELGIEPQDNITLSITAENASSVSPACVKTVKYSNLFRIIYHHESLPVGGGGTGSTLTAGDFVAAFAQDPSAINALANVLQGSNMLADKISQLNKSTSSL